MSVFDVSYIIGRMTAWFIRGFVKLEKFRKSEKKIGSGWVGKAPTQISFFFFRNIYFFCVFIIVVHVSKKNGIGGLVGGVWTIQVFLGFLEFF